MGRDTQVIARIFQSRLGTFLIFPSNFFFRFAFITAPVEINSRLMTLVLHCCFWTGTHTNHQIENTINFMTIQTILLQNTAGCINPLLKDPLILLSPWWLVLRHVTSLSVTIRYIYCIILWYWADCYCQVIITCPYNNYSSNLILRMLHAKHLACNGAFLRFFSLQTYNC